MAYIYICLSVVHIYIYMLYLLWILTVEEPHISTLMT